VVGDSLVDLRMAQAAGALAVAVPEYANDVDLLSAHADILLSGARSVLSTTQLRPGHFGGYWPAIEGPRSRMQFGGVAPQPAMACIIDLPFPVSVMSCQSLDIPVRRLLYGY
jgi:uncharacterized protein YceK